MGKCSPKELAYAKEYRQKNREKVREYNKKYREGREEQFRQTAKEYRADLKKELLSHYGKNGQAMCQWWSCSIDDVDMLTLDHIADDGAEHRRQLKSKGGTAVYYAIKQAGFPEGFQTLCWNHQWKKRMEKHRAL